MIKPKSRAPRQQQATDSIHLDFGCGSQVRNPFKANRILSVDIERHTGNIPTHVIARGEPLPFPSNMFSSVSAYDVLEHLSRDSQYGNEFISIMRELFRVLKPGGLALFIFPAFPHKDAFSDPTHVNFITEDTLSYFLGPKSGETYAGIDTEFESILNKKLRLWKRWVDKASVNPQDEFKTFRRRLSLAKRTLTRFLLPQHRIWILQKPPLHI